MARLRTRPAFSIFLNTLNLTRHLPSSFARRATCIQRASNAQEMLPLARVVYCSATGVTDIGEPAVLLGYVWWRREFPLFPCWAFVVVSGYMVWLFHCPAYFCVYFSPTCPVCPLCTRRGRCAACAYFCSTQRTLHMVIVRFSPSAHTRFLVSSYFGVFLPVRLFSGGAFLLFEQALFFPIALRVSLTPTTAKANFTSEQIVHETSMQFQEDCHPVVVAVVVKKSYHGNSSNLGHSTKPTRRPQVT